MYVVDAASAAGEEWGREGEATNRTRERENHKTPTRMCVYVCASQKLKILLGSFEHRRTANRK